MSRTLSVHADLSVRSPSGTGSLVGSGDRVEVSLPWRLLLSIVRGAGLRRSAVGGLRFLEERDVRVRLRLPGLPTLDLDRMAFAFSLGAVWALCLCLPLLLA